LKECGAAGHRQAETSSARQPLIATQPEDAIVEPANVPRVLRGVLGGIVYHEVMMPASADRDIDPPAAATCATVGKPATEARQGVISGRVVLVLLTSTALVIVALVSAYLLM
jgi:hypothetical protein